LEVDVLVEGFAGGHGMVGGKWDRVWVAENEEDGEEDRAKLASCLQHLPDAAHITTFPSTAIPRRPSASSSPTTSPTATKAEPERAEPQAEAEAEAAPDSHAVVAVGGTFDHLHAGHKILLSMAVWLARRKIIVGVADDNLLVNKSHRDLIQPLSLRISRVQSFLHLLNPRLQLEVVPIRDVAGPTGWERDVDALVVSKESVAGGEAIAKIREEKGLPPLRQYIIDVIASSPPTRLPSPVPSTDAPPTSSSATHLPPTSLEHEDDAERLKTLKMGSTYIREWLASRGEGGGGE